MLAHRAFRASRFFVIPESKQHEIRRVPHRSQALDGRAATGGGRAARSVPGVRGRGRATWRPCGARRAWATPPTAAWAAGTWQQAGCRRADAAPLSVQALWSRGHDRAGGPGQASAVFGAGDCVGAGVVEPRGHACAGGPTSRQSVARRRCGRRTWLDLAATLGSRCRRRPAVAVAGVRDGADVARSRRAHHRGARRAGGLERGRR